MRKSFIFTVIIVSCILAAGCGREAKWRIDGHIDGYDNAPVILETSFNGAWYGIDTVVTDNKGNFSFHRPSPDNPTIFRLNLNGKVAYFPIDSAETIIVRASADNFDTDYTLAGSEPAIMLTNVNAMISKAGTSAASNDSLKQKLASMVLVNPSGAVAYYIINSCTSLGEPLFNPLNRNDLRLIGAVANAFSEKSPDDPRTQYLKNLYLTSRNAGREPTMSITDTIEVIEVGFPEISLPDNTGKTINLSDIASNGPVIVSFTSYSADFSPALNMELGNIYEKYRKKGLNIYQVGIDADEYRWRWASQNIPWIAVYNQASEGANYLVRYNVTKIPVFFLIDANGNLVERIDDITQLDKIAGKYL